MHETNFKAPPLSRKVARTLQRRERKADEDQEKRRVRQRDRYCRFPLCGCKAFGLALHVSHAQHKGMGGNPKGERSAADRMIYVCSARHRENRIAIDRGTLRWKPLTDRGSDGPIAWLIDCDALEPHQAETYRGWRELARERAIHIYVPLDAWQQRTIGQLAAMTL